VTRGFNSAVPFRVMMLRSQGENQGTKERAVVNFSHVVSPKKKTVPQRIEEEGTEPETSDTLEILTLTGCCVASPLQCRRVLQQT
jgi:hypothetical protein